MLKLPAKWRISQPIYCAEALSWTSPVLDTDDDVRDDETCQDDDCRHLFGHGAH